MQGLPRIAPQSIWLNGAPNWPPCEMWSTSSPFTTDGKMIVATSMHDWSTVPGTRVPPPVVRQVAGVTQLIVQRQSLSLLSTETRGPVLSYTHSVPLLSLASAGALTAMLIPVGHVNRIQPWIVVEPPASRWIGRATITGVVWSVQSTKDGRPA